MVGRKVISARDGVFYRILKFILHLSLTNSFARLAQQLITVACQLEVKGESSIIQLYNSIT